MIHYQLRCGQSHDFDGWFKDSASFEKQAKRRLIECPECGGTDVERALMAPALAKRAAMPVPVTQSPPPAQIEAAPNPPPERLPAQMLAFLQRMRAMHRGDVEPKRIYGETTEEQAESLAEEGIAVTKIPWVPRADG
jgi:hypothetical protein